MLTYIPDSNISTHFKMREVAKSDAASRNNIDNTPSSEVLDNAMKTAIHILEPIRVHFGIPFSPNSWYRGEALEKFICRQSFIQWCNSKGLPVDDSSWAQYFARKSHPRGQAVDIEIPGIPNDDLFNWVDQNIPEYDQLIREFPKAGDPYSGWVHVSFNEGNNRRQKFTIG